MPKRPEEDSKGTYIDRTPRGKKSMPEHTASRPITIGSTQKRRIIITLTDRSHTNIREANSVCAECMHKLANSAGGGACAKCEGFNSAGVAHLNETVVGAWNDSKKANLVRRAKCKATI